MLSGRYITYPQLASNLQQAEEQEHVGANPQQDEEQFDNLAQHDLTMATVKPAIPARKTVKID